MKTKKRRKKIKYIDGVLYEAITSYYDGHVIGWGKVHNNENIQNNNFQRLSFST